jgi:hypothetical protein
MYTYIGKDGNLDERKMKVRQMQKEQAFALEGQMRSVHKYTYICIYVCTSMNVSMLYIYVYIYIRIYIYIYI